MYSDLIPLGFLPLGNDCSVECDTISYNLNLFQDPPLEMPCSAHLRISMVMSNAILPFDFVASSHLPINQTFAVAINTAQG